MLDESHDILDKVKKVRYLLNGKTIDGSKATYGPSFISLRYSTVLLASTLLSIFKDDEMASQFQHCVKYNLYGLNKSAEILSLEFDRTRTAKRVYEQLIKNGDIIIERDKSHEYLCLTTKGRQRCLRKIDELVLLDNYLNAISSLSDSYSEAKKFVSKGVNNDPVYLQYRKQVDDLIDSISDFKPIQRSKALVIGISKYNSLQHLDFCAKDGNDMYTTLDSLGYNITENNKLVGHISWTRMRDAIYDFFTDKTIQPNELLLFYYSGHGIPDEDGDVYLSTSEIDPDVPNRRGFGFGELTKMMQKCISTKIVCILDCCYSGSAKISKGHEEDAAKLGMAALDKESRSLSSGEGRCILAASQALQQAYGLEEGFHSIFTYYLLEGLKGNARDAMDTNGNVTVDSLGKYVYNMIMSLPVDKRPKQKPIRKVEASGDIILAHYSSENIKTKEITSEKSSKIISQPRGTDGSIESEINIKKSIEDLVREYYEESKRIGKPISILECAKKLNISYTKVRSIISGLK